MNKVGNHCVEVKKEIVCCGIGRKQYFLNIKLSTVDFFYTNV